MTDYNGQAFGSFGNYGSDYWNPKKSPGPTFAQPTGANPFGFQTNPNNNFTRAFAPLTMGQADVYPNQQTPKLMQPPLVQGQADVPVALQTLPTLNQPGLTPGQNDVPGPGTQPQANSPQSGIPYATFDNLMSYFSPYRDFLLQQGTDQIQQSAAARGFLKSSGTINDIGNWANQAGSQAYDQALNSFFTDRNAMQNYFQDSRNFDWNRYQYENNLQYGMYNSEQTDWNTKLKDFYDQLSGISNVGIDAAKNSGDLATSSASSLATIFMALANMNAQGGVASANNLGNFWQSLIGLGGLFNNFGGSSSSSSSDSSSSSGS